MFKKEYSQATEGDEQWKRMPVPRGELFSGTCKSTYVRQAPYFDGMTQTPADPKPITGARVLALLGDSVTTDHISPAGAIEKSGPAARYLTNNDVLPKDYNQYGARRGNHEVMVRGNICNIRLKNMLAPGTEEASRSICRTRSKCRSTMRRCNTKGRARRWCYRGEEYGTGSSRDWAAKGPRLLGIKAAIAESFERIHRSNLIGMGIVPLVSSPAKS